MPYDTIWGGISDALMTSQQIQHQRAQEIAEQTFRESQLAFNQKQFQEDQTQNVIRNKIATDAATEQKNRNLDQSNLDWAKYFQDVAEAEDRNAKAEADRKSRETIATIRANVQKEIADAKNLTLEERYTLSEAMKNADTPEQAAGLQEWIRGRLRQGTPPTAPPTVAPTPPAGPFVSPTLHPPEGSDLWKLLDAQGVLNPAVSPQGATPPPAVFDPSQPFGGTAGAQARSRNAYADIAEQKAQHLQDQFTLDAMKANASVAHQKAMTDKLKVMTPLERDLTLQRIAESKARIQQRGQEIAARERNTQWEHQYKNASLALRKQMAGGSLDSIRQRMSTAGAKMVTVGKEQDKLIAMIEQLTSDRDKAQVSIVGGNLLEGPQRDQRIRELNARLEDVTTVKEAAKENYQHYRQVLEETGNLNVSGKPVAPASGTSRRGTVPPAPVTLPPGMGTGRFKDLLPGQTSAPSTPARSAPRPSAPVTQRNQGGTGNLGAMIDQQLRPGTSAPSRSSAPAKKSAPKKENDEAIKARMRKKYGLN